MISVPQKNPEILNTLSPPQQPFEGACAVIRTKASVDRTEASVEMLGDQTGRFAWASVTKPVSAYACLVALEEGSVTLDDPIRGFPDLTLAHLLAHAGGLAFDEPTRIGQPGSRRQYSNAGIRLAAAHVAARTGMRYSDYVHDGVLVPLGMHGVRWADEAAGAAGTIADLAKFAAELLRPTLIGSTTLRMATSAWWPELDGVVPGFGMQRPCPWGLGFEIKGSKAPHWTGTRNSAETFGHFGQSGSMLCVDPVAQMAWCWLSPQPFGPWAKAAWPTFIDNTLSDLIDGPTPPDSR